MFEINSSPRRQPQVAMRTIQAGPTDIRSTRNLYQLNYNIKDQHRTSDTTFQPLFNDRPNHFAGIPPVDRLEPRQGLLLCLHLVDWNVLVHGTELYVAERCPPFC